MAAARSLTWEERELLACAADFEYWVRRYVKIFDAKAFEWIPFDLWPEQVKVAEMVEENQQSLYLKARQLGLTWLMLAIILHGMLFKPIFLALVFSKRENEALYLIGEERLRGMYRQLPHWMQARAITVDAAMHFGLSNGSGVRAFPSNAGDSYTASFAFIDEADLVPDLKELLGRVKPTINAGGKIVMVSRADKSKPQSIFKQIYRSAKESLNEWATMFLPWSVHPARTQAWYDAQSRDTLKNTGSLDDLWEHYPATDIQALAERTLDKRIPAVWLNPCYVELQPIQLDVLPAGAPNIPGLNIYALPEPDVEYAIGADPAEGNPTSDDSAMHLVRQDNNEEIAMLAGKFEPAVLASHIDKIGMFYNQAPVMVERNNHGHAVILWLKDNSRLKRMLGLDRKEGWLSNSLGKAQLYDNATDMVKEGEAVIHSFKTFTQLASIEGATLRAPDGQMDDCADSYALAITHRMGRIKVGNIHVLKRG